MTPSGGTDYSYIWNTGATTRSLSGVASGTYHRHRHGHQHRAVRPPLFTLVINGSSAVTASSTGVTGTSCGQNNGSATAIGTGGNGNYTYNWSTGATTATVSNLPSGNHTVTVTDASGCTGILPSTLPPQAPVSAGVPNFTHTSCGQNNGVASAVATGGNGNYIYNWSNGQTTAQAINLGAGSYTVTVTDAAGCTGTASVTINASSAPNSSISSPTNVSCFGQNNGSATVTATGGSAPYTYLWSNSNTTATAGQQQQVLTQSR
ncbi:MAG: SprB repeat-containing protein [Bacteroidia bacterium]